VTQQIESLKKQTNLITNKLQKMGHRRISNSDTIRQANIDISKLDNPLDGRSGKQG
jgi:hypothetical protein